MELVNMPYIVEHPKQHPIVKPIFAAKFMTICPKCDRDSGWPHITSGRAAQRVTIVFSELLGFPDHR